MADPKYAGLPGIAYDQPDLYESSNDATIADKQVMEIQDLTDSVEELSTNVKESFDKFQNYWLNSLHTDFSGQISRKCHSGYSSAWNGPYELGASGKKESPLQKLNRLKCELSELEEEIAVNEIREENCRPEILAAEVALMQKQLMAIKMKNLAGSSSFPTSDMFISAKKMLTGLQSSKQTDSDLRDVKCDGESQHENNQLIYELQYNPSYHKLYEATKVTELVQRLDKLEKAAGISSEHMGQLCAELGQKSMVEIVKLVCLKVSLLEVPHVDQIEGRLAAILQKINMIINKQGAIEEADKATKIKELFDIAKKLEPLVLLLPQVIDRLSSLKALHEEASRFSETLVQVENSQQHLDAAIQKQSQVLQEIKEGISSNVKNIEATIRILNV